MRPNKSLYACDNYTQIANPYRLSKGVCFFQYSPCSSNDFFEGGEAQATSWKASFGLSNSLCQAQATALSNVVSRPTSSRARATALLSTAFASDSECVHNDCRISDPMARRSVPAYCAARRLSSEAIKTASTSFGTSRRVWFLKSSRGKRPSVVQSDFRFNRLPANTRGPMLQLS